MKSLQIHVLLVVLFLSFCCVTKTVLADSYYVNPDGADENPGTQELPWQSIQYAIQHLSGGDTLTITAGEYIEQDGIMITNELTPNISGTQTDITELIAQEGVVLTVDNDVDPIITIEGSQSSPIEFIEIKGFHLNYASSGLRLNYTNQCSITQNIITSCTRGIEISNSSYCRITYNKIFGHHTGILMENAQNTTVSYNNCSKGMRDGIHVSTGCHNSSITDNICIDNSTTDPFGSESWWMTNAGIYIENSDSLSIERNLLKDNKHNKSNYIYDASGLFFNGAATNISILNNSFINNNIHLQSSTNTFNPLVANNLLYNSGMMYKLDVLPTNTKTVNIANNVIYCGTGYFSYFYVWYYHSDLDYKRGGFIRLNDAVYFPVSKREIRLLGFEYYGYYTGENVDFYNNIMVSGRDRNIILFDNDSYDAHNIDYNFYNSSITDIANLDNEGLNNTTAQLPLFRDTDTLNFQLLSNSPCLTTGYNTQAMGIYGGQYARVDTDNDGMPDDWEIKYQFDHLTPNDTEDADCDGLTNYQEFLYKLNPLDNDSDNDGLNDNEIFVYNTLPYYHDTDLDHISDFDETQYYNTSPINKDSDGDGISDYDELFGWQNDTGTYTTNPLESDTDKDSLSDGDERTQNTDPHNNDSDNDGITDGYEVYGFYLGDIKFTSDPTISDTDNDGSNDYEEKINLTDPRDIMSNINDSPVITINNLITEMPPVSAIGPDVKITGIVSDLNRGNSPIDTIEYAIVYSNASPPSDSQYTEPEIVDGLHTHTASFQIQKTLSTRAYYKMYIRAYDEEGFLKYTYIRFYCDNDSDNDGLADRLETNKYFTDPNTPDSDNDGLYDGTEIYAYQTDPKDNDSDNDLLSDGTEVQTTHTDPLNSDTDNDGISDYDELFEFMTDPNNSDTDNDGIPDKAEISHNMDPLNSYNNITITTIPSIKSKPNPTDFNISSSSNTVLVTYRTTKSYFSNLEQKLYYELYSQYGYSLKSDCKLDIETNSYCVTADNDSYCITWLDNDGITLTLKGMILSEWGDIMQNKFTICEFDNTITSPQWCVDIIDNTYCIVWQNKSNNKYAIYGSFINKQGSALVTQFLVNEPSENNQKNPVICSSVNYFCVAWEGEDSYGEEIGIYTQLFDNEGNFYNDQMLLSDFSADNSDPQITSNGINFSIAWKNSSGIEVTTFDPDQTNSEHITILSNDVCLITMTHHNGEFYLTWAAQNPATLENFIMSQHISENGSCNGDPIVLHNYSGINISFQKIITVSNGIDLINLVSYTCPHPEHNYMCQHLEYMVLHDNVIIQYNQFWANSISIPYTPIASLTAQPSSAALLWGMNDGLASDTDLIFIRKQVSSDFDADGVENQTELNYGLNPYTCDSDDDGFVDYAEVSDIDDDLLYDAQELANQTSLLEPDSDNDGWNDYEEVVIYNTNPLHPYIESPLYPCPVENIGLLKYNGDHIISVKQKLSDLNRPGLIVVMDSNGSPINTPIQLNEYWDNVNVTSLKENFLITFRQLVEYYDNDTSSMISYYSNEIFGMIIDNNGSIYKDIFQIHTFDNDTPTCYLSSNDENYLLVWELDNDSVYGKIIDNDGIVAEPAFLIPENEVIRFDGDWRPQHITTFEYNNFAAKGIFSDGHKYLGSLITSGSSSYVGYDAILYDAQGAIIKNQFTVFNLNLYGGSIFGGSNGDYFLSWEGMFGNECIFIDNDGSILSKKFSITKSVHGSNYYTLGVTESTNGFILFLYTGAHEIYCKHFYHPNSDIDNDGLCNMDEILFGTDLTRNDTDNDSMNDGWEVINRCNPLIDDSGIDNDNDSLPNSVEFALKSNPNNADSDCDGCPDGYEVTTGTDLNHYDSQADLDCDGLNHFEEFQANTNPFLVDTDCDGQDDKIEVFAGSNPTDKNSLFKYTIETDNDNNTVILWPCIPNRTYNLLISNFIDGNFIPLQENIEVFQNMQKSFTDTGKDNNNDDDFDDETDILPSSAVDSRYYRIIIRK